MQTFWNQILYWADETLFPWIKEYLPQLEFYVRDAFHALDTVVISTYRNIKAPWIMLRQYLLKALVRFQSNTRNEWVKRITYWVTTKLESKQVVRVVVEQRVDLDCLPDEVRQEWLKRGNTTQDVDVTLLRDQELREGQLELISGEVEEIVDVDSLPDDIQQEWDVLSNSTTQNSSVEIQQKSHIKGWPSKILPEGWRRDLQDLRYTWLLEGKPELWIKIMTGFRLLEMLKAYLQIKVENIWLPKKKRS